jgi:indoleacetamide hydrolase
MSLSGSVIDLSPGRDDPLSGLVRARESIRSGALSATEAVTECLRRIESDAGASLNAFITVAGDAALLEARELDGRRNHGWVGPLHGVPVAIKDNLATAGCRTTGGTKIFGDWIPTRDAAVVHALRKAGAVVIGKTNLHEAAFGITCKNEHYGVVRNPRSVGRIAGGSSGGSAAAVAAGLCPGSLGSDTGGSVRVPAALCGCVGFKPSIGRLSTDGLMSLSSTCDVIGPITRSVEDARLMDAVMRGDSEPPVGEGGQIRGIRVAVLTDYFDDVDAATAGLLNEFVESLAVSGADLSRAAVKGAGEAMGAGFDIVLPEAWNLVQDILSTVRPGWRLADHLDEFGPDVEQTLRGEAESPVPARRYLQAMWETRPRLQAAFDEVLSTADFLVCATTPTPAVVHEEDPEMSFGGVRVPTFTTFIRNCFVISVAGLPAISIPIGLTAEGLPVGAQIIGRRGDDDALMRFAAACESMRTD